MVISLLLILVCLLKSCRSARETSAIEVSSGINGNYIKWVDFNVTYEALCAAYDLDVASYGEKIHLDWIELLAYAAVPLERTAYP